MWGVKGHVAVEFRLGPKGVCNGGYLNSYSLPLKLAPPALLKHPEP